MSITRNFDLVLNAGTSVPPVINVSQYDQGESWVFTLYTELGAKYTPSTGAIVGIKSDGNVITNAGTVNSSGQVVILETQQMTAAAGTAVYELQIDSTTHGTANFVVQVEQSPMDDGVVSDSDLSLIQQALNAVTPTVIAETVTDWMDDNITQPTVPVVDASLTVQGAAADAKVTGDAIRAGVGGLTADIKEALLACFDYVSWKGTEGQDYYDALYAALYPPADLSYISCVYTQSGTVYDSDSLDSLKADLVVTAHYDDLTTETVTTYTLSGTLTTGTSTITVTYGGKTTTFTVTVTHDTGFVYGLVDSSSAVTGHYIDENGDVQESSNSGYYADYIDIRNLSSLLIHYAVTSGHNYRISVYDSNQTFTRQIHVEDSNYYTLSPNTGERYIRLSWYSPYTPKFYIESGTPTSLLMEIGDIDSTTGQNKTESKRIRTNGYIPAETAITVQDCPWGTWASWAVTNNGYFFRCYDSTYSFLGSVLNSGSMFRADCSNVSLPTGTAYVRIVMQKNNNSFSAGFTTGTYPFAIDGVSYQVTEAS